LKAKKWFTNNLELKILSLVLAIVTWFYINYELAKLKNKKENAIVSMLHYEVISKKLPIELTIAGEVRPGYELVTDDIVVEPETIVVVGPDYILDEVASVRTMPIDITEYTKNIDRQIVLAPIAKGITLEDSFIKVYIPIAKKEKEAK